MFRWIKVRFTKLKDISKNVIQKLIFRDREIINAEQLIYSSRNRRERRNMKNSILKTYECNQELLETGKLQPMWEGNHTGCVNTFTWFLPL